MSDYKFETLQLHVGQEHPDPASAARAVPIYATTSYVFHNSQHAADRFGLADTGNIYGRLTNSTQGVFEQRISALEGGVAGLAVASGAAAITYTIQALAQQGDHIVSQRTVYGGPYNLLAHTLAHLGLTREQCIAFGDGGNDVTMLDYAGIGVAMGNACDTAKQAADYVTDDIMKDGLAKALGHFHLI